MTLQRTFDEREWIGKGKGWSDTRFTPTRGHAQEGGKSKERVVEGRDASDGPHPLTRA